MNSFTFAFILLGTFGAGAVTGLLMTPARSATNRRNADRLAAAERDLEHRQTILDELADQRRRGAQVGTSTFDNLPEVPPRVVEILTKPGRHRTPDDDAQPAAAVEPTPRRDPMNPPSLAGMGLDEAVVELAARQQDRVNDSAAFYGIVRWLGHQDAYAGVAT